jgi:hypothetical protein
MFRLRRRVKARAVVATANLISIAGMMLVLASSATSFSRRGRMDLQNRLSTKVYSTPRPTLAGYEKPVMVQFVFHSHETGFSTLGRFVRVL